MMVLQEYLLLGIFAAATDDDAAIVAANRLSHEVVGGLPCWSVGGHFPDGCGHDVTETGGSIYLSITILIVGIGERGIGMGGSGGDNVEHIVGSKRGTGLEPEGYDTSHHRTGHRGTTVTVPRIGTPVVLEMLYVPGDIACLGVVLKIIAAIGGDDVLPGSHDVGLDKTVECGAYA